MVALKTLKTTFKLYRAITVIIIDFQLANMYEHVGTNCSCTFNVKRSVVIFDFLK